MRGVNYLFDLMQLCDPLACAGRSSRWFGVIAAVLVLVLVFVFVLIDVHAVRSGDCSRRERESERESGRRDFLCLATAPRSRLGHARAVGGA